MKIKLILVAIVSLIASNSWAVEGTLCIENKHDVDINVGLQHFGCVGVWDGIFTVCTPQGIFENVTPGETRAKSITLGMSTGYTALGKLTGGTKEGQFAVCQTGLNGWVVFKKLEGGGITCDTLNKDCQVSEKGSE